MESRVDPFCTVGNSEVQLTPMLVRLKEDERDYDHIRDSALYREGPVKETRNTARIADVTSSSEFR